MCVYRRTPEEVQENVIYSITLETLMRLQNMVKGNAENIKHNEDKFQQKFRTPIHVLDFGSFHVKLPDSEQITFVRL
jgi:hypothetical protein